MCVRFLQMYTHEATLLIMGTSAREHCVLGWGSQAQSSYSTECFLCPSGSLSRAGPLPLLRQPPIMQPPMDLKQILPFPLEPAPTLGLFSNYSTVSTVCLPCPTPLSPLTPSVPPCCPSKPNSVSLPVTLRSSCLVPGLLTL